MPAVVRYEQQVQREGVTREGFRAADYGEGLGPGLKQAGRGIATIAEADAEIAKVRREQLTLEQNRRFAEATLGLEESESTMRSEAARGGAGHRDAINARITGAETDFIEAIPDREVQSYFRARWAAYRNDLVGRAHKWEVETRAEYQADNAAQSGSIIANRVAINPTPEGLVQGLTDIAALRDGLTNTPEDSRETVIRVQQRRAVVSWANSMNGSGQHNRLLAALDDPEMNLTRYLEPEDVATLRRGAQVEQRREATELRAREAEQEGEAREQIRLFTSRITAGDEPTPEEFAEHAELARRYGLDDVEFNIGVREVQVGINRETRNWTAPMFEQELARLRAKPERTTDENVRLSHLESIAASRIAEYNSNPHPRAARMGNPAPPIDFQNPTRQSINQRIAWAESLARETGLALPPYFTPSEQDHLKQRLAGGAAARLDAAMALRNMLGADRAEMAARQLEPNDESLRVLVRLAPPFANIYVRGREALDQNPGMFDQNGRPNDVRRGTGFGRDDAQRVFMEVQAAIPQELRGAYFDAARNIAAGLASGSGAPMVTEDIFRMALHRAAGATGQPGRLVGGLAWRNNQPLWLPDTMSSADFERRVARAGAREWAGANRDSTGRSGSGIFFRAQNGGLGRAVNRGELNQMHFQTVRPGIYRIVGPQGGVMLNWRGEPYEFDVRLLP